MNHKCIFSNLSDESSKPLFTGINPYEYNKVSQKMHKFLAPTKLKFLDEIPKKIRQEFLINPDEKEAYILNYYAQCRINCKLLVMFDVMDHNKLLNNLSETSLNCYFYKVISLRFVEAISLFYQINYYLNLFKTYDEMRIYVKELFGERSKISVSFLLFESGCKDQYEEIINNVCLGSRCILFQHFGMVVDFVEFILNNNSLSYLKYTYSRNFFEERFFGCKGYLETYKKYLNENFTQLEQLKFMVFSSSVLYTLGLRGCSDLDIFVCHEPGNTKTFAKKVEKMAEKREGYEFMDISLKGMGDWVAGGKKEHWDSFFVTEWPNMFGAENIADVVYNPKYHFYFYGIKIVALFADIERRKIRERPAGYADLIAINRYLKLDLKMPEIPFEYYKSIGVLDKINTEDKLNHFYCTILAYLKRRYNIKMSLGTVKSIIKPSRGILNKLEVNK